MGTYEDGYTQAMKSIKTAVNVTRDPLLKALLQTGSLPEKQQGELSMAAKIIELIDNELGEE